MTVAPRNHGRDILDSTGAFGFCQQRRVVLSAAGMVVAIGVACWPARSAAQDSSANTGASPGELQNPAAAVQSDQGAECLTPEQLKEVAPGVQAVNLNVLRGPGELPVSCFGAQRKAVSPIPGNQPRWYAQSAYHWAPSLLVSQPLYFEDVSLERYGWTSCLQPAVSGAKFFGTVAILPYKIGVDCPRQCSYLLGHARPGSCAPPVREHLPFSLKGVALQAGAATGAVFLLQ